MNGAGESGEYMLEQLRMGGQVVIRGVGQVIQVRMKTASGDKSELKGREWDDLERKKT